MLYYLENRESGGSSTGQQQLCQDLHGHVDLAEEDRQLRCLYYTTRQVRSTFPKGSYMITVECILQLEVVGHRSLCSKDYTKLAAADLPVCPSPHLGASAPESSGRLLSCRPMKVAMILAYHKLSLHWFVLC